MGREGDNDPPMQQEEMETNFSSILNSRPLSSSQMRKRNKKSVRDAILYVSAGDIAGSEN